VFIDCNVPALSRDLIDKAALDFVSNLNTRQNRRRLVQVPSLPTIIVIVRRFMARRAIASISCPSSRVSSRHFAR
jgi:hypothetical protein